MLMIRSNDCRPTIFFMLCGRANLTTVRRRDLKNYKADEIYAEIFYRTPDASNPDEFAHEMAKIDSVPDAIKLYESELEKYNERKNARYERVYQNNKEYFDNAFARINRKIK